MPNSIQMALFAHLLLSFLTVQGKNKLPATIFVQFQPTPPSSHGGALTTNGDFCCMRALRQKTYMGVKIEGHFVSYSISLLLIIKLIQLIYLLIVYLLNQ